MFYFEHGSSLLFDIKWLISPAGDLKTCMKNLATLNKYMNNVKNLNFWLVCCILYHFFFLFHPFWTKLYSSWHKKSDSKQLASLTGYFSNFLLLVVLFYHSFFLIKNLVFLSDSGSLFSSKKRVKMKWMN